MRPSCVAAALIASVLSEQVMLPNPSRAAEVTSETRSISFEECLALIRQMATEFAVAPVNIVETNDLRIVRFLTVDGSVLVTCSRLDQVMVVTMSQPDAGQVTPTYLGDHGDWNVYAFTEGSEKICYMASEPTEQEGNYTRRDNPAMLVTQRPGPKVVDEVSVQPGYNYLDGSEVEVVIGGDKFLLFTRSERAWTKSEDADKALVAAMKRGAELTIRGTSIYHTYSLDTYSLRGFPAAYDALVEACQAH